MRFAGLLRREPRAIGFGLLHTIAATIGQTFVIALFLPGIKQSFSLGDAQISLIFTAATLASAVVLWKVGAWLDRTDLVRYCLGCGLFLAVSCAVIALAEDLAVLVIGVFCLRLAGNGLLTHIAFTATARYFTRERGRALSLVLLGSSVGEAGLPAPIVALIAAIGWRSTLAAIGCLGLLLVILAAVLVSGQARFRREGADDRQTQRTLAQPSRPEPLVAPRRYFMLTGPLFLAMPLTVTGAVFHQALIAENIGVSLQWFAVSFIAFAIARVATSLIVGPVADRVGSDWLFCVHLLPLAVGTALLITVSGAGVVPVYWFCSGVTSGMGGVLQTTVLAERVPGARLAEARSILGAVTIIAAAVGPTLYGLGLAAGAGVPAILWSSVAILLLATAIGIVGVTSTPHAA